MKESSSSLKSMIITTIVIAVIGGLLVATLPTLAVSDPPTNAPEVWVNDDWIVNGSGNIVDGHEFGYDAFATIGDGIYNVAPGGRVNVYSGTYNEGNEGVTISKPLILNGSKSGMPGGDGGRGSDEAIINGATGGIAITVTSNDVVIDGFEIAYKSTTNFGIKADASNNLVVNNTRVLSGTSTAISVDGDSAVLKDNYIYVPMNVYGLIVGTGNNAEVSGNRMSLIMGAGNLTSWTGDNVNINNNLIGELAAPTGVSAADVSSLSAPASGMLYVIGNNTEITYNLIGSPTWNYSYGIVVLGNGNDVSGNDIYVDTCEFDAIYMGALDDNLPVGSITDNDIIAGNIQGNAILALGDSPIIDNNRIGGESNPPIYSAIYWSGPSATVTDNDVRVGFVGADFLVYGEGDGATITGNEIELYGGNNSLGYFGDGGSVTDNVIGLIWSSLGTADVGSADAPEGVMLFYEGDDALIADNEIGGDLWLYNYGISVNGNNGSVYDNTIEASEVLYSIIYYEGEFGIVDHNNLTVEYCYDEGIWYSGDNATITNNEINVDELYCDVIDYDGYGEYDYGATITGNVIDCGYIEWAAICYSGPAGLIADNEIYFIAAGFGIDVRSDEGMIVRDNWITGDEIYEAIDVYCDEGTVSGNRIDVFEVYDCGIFYSGNAGNVIGNYDEGEYLAEYPFIVYLSDGEGLIDSIGDPLFGTGHGVIKDNVGGSIIYMGDLYFDDWDWEYIYEPANYGTISNNTIDSDYVGITAYGDFNAIDNNTIKAVYGISSNGFMDTIADNTIDASYKADFIVPLSAGIGFDGNKNTVVRNEVYNATIGIFNVGMFTVDDMPYLTSMPLGTSESVNSTLESIAANMTLINGFAGEYFSTQFTEAGVQASGDTEHMSPAVNAEGVVAAIDGFGYRGYGNVISDNLILNDWNDEYLLTDWGAEQSDNLAGIVSLGYDFVVDGNVIDNKEDSDLLAGIIVGGDGGKVTNNEIYNVTALGAYYGGLLEFDGEELVPSDLLGIDALISDNLVDNSQYFGGIDDDLFDDGLVDALLPVGIAFTGYNGDIKDNDLLGVGIGIVTLQYASSVADNTVDGFKPIMYVTGVTGASEIGDLYGMAGLVAIGDNMAVTGNSISNMTFGTVFAGLDEFSEHGNALIADNTLTDNLIQMAYIPGYFLFDLDGAPSELNTVNLVEVLDANMLDRAIYVTDSETGELVDMYVFMSSSHFEIGLPMIGVFGDLNLAAEVAQGGIGGTTVNVRPGTYGIYIPILIHTPGMTFLGDPNAPETTVVDTSPMTMYGELFAATPMSTSAFEVNTNNVTITGFEITNSSNTVPVNGSLVNYGIAVGYTGIITSTGVEPQVILLSDCVFTNNTILNMSAGFYLDICRNVTIEYNKLKGNAVGINLTELCDANSTEIHYNDIAGNTEFGVNNNNGEDRYVPLAIGTSNWVNATNNWWGSYLGPYHPTLNPDGTGDNVTDYVLFDPILTMPVFSSVFTFDLPAGWSMISFPIELLDDQTQHLPLELRANLTDMWWWNGSAWWYYSGTQGFSPYYTQLCNVTAGNGYWVKLSNPTTFTVSGGVTTTGVPTVGSGWTMVGVEGLNSIAPATAYPDCLDMWYWDHGTWDYFSGTQGYSPYYPNLTSMDPGNAYWVHY